MSSKKTNTIAIYNYPTNFHPISNQPVIVFSSKHLLKINNFLCNLKTFKKIIFFLNKKFSLKKFHFWEIPTSKEH